MDRSLKSKIRFSFLLLLSLFIGCTQIPEVELKNEEFCLVLSCNRNGIPYIKKGYWLNSGKKAFSDQLNNYTYNDWLPADLLPPDSAFLQPDLAVWKIDSLKKFKTATAVREFGKLRLTWTIELSDRGTLFRAYVLLSNSGEKALSIDWYPVWLSGWLETPSENCRLEYWEALSYQPNSKKIPAGSSTELHSSGYSSDNQNNTGSVPYWKIIDRSQTLCFSLSWCGGWKTDIYKNENGLNVDIKLPPEETQLILQPGESIDGPKLYLFSSADSNLMQSRSEWLGQRKRWADHLFTKPENHFPLLYNHWYSVRFDLNSRFLNNQINALIPYHFDFFIIDAGWYNHVGDWTPHPQKFKPGEFETALQRVKKNGVKVGIWTCPWLVEIRNAQFPPEIDEPHFYRKFMNAYALDLAGSDFEGRLNAHLSDLKRQFDIDWWKYDQELFGDSSRQGKMKNINALEKALAGVRRSFPDLYIENCMSGGRMINEFTDQISQIHWIRDGGGSGLKHAASNIREALGAIQFLSASKVQRWTNRPDELNTEGEELLKMYCRSAMIGVWGISADMNKIDDIQRKVILSEIKNYRRMNVLKSDLLVEILYPSENSEIVGLIYYDKARNNAAVLLFRWEKSGIVSANLKLALLENASYKISNVDKEDETAATGKDLRSIGFKFSLDEGQLSALYFIEKIVQ